jgi:hypothetical protein
VKYAKPQVNKLSPAVEAIQSDQVKTIHVSYDGTMLAATPAYEADE